MIHRSKDDSLNAVERAAREAVTISPFSPHAWFVLGVTLMMQGDKKRAKECFTRTIRLDPSFEMARVSLKTLLDDEVGNSTIDVPQQVVASPVPLHSASAPPLRPRTTRATFNRPVPKPSSNVTASSSPDASKRMEVLTLKFTIGSVILALIAVALAAVGLVPAFWEAVSPESVIETFDNRPPVRVEVTHRYVAGGGFLFRLPNTPPGFEGDMREGISSYTGNMLRYSVTNYGDTTVLLNNQLPIQLLEYQSTDERVPVLNELGGGTGYYLNFTVEIAAHATGGIFWATPTEYEQESDLPEGINTRHPDFYTLEPGETVAFQVAVDFAEAGIYTFRGGVAYLENGEYRQVWMPDNIMALFPKYVNMWRPALQPNESPRHYVFLGACSLNPSYERVSQLLDMYVCESVPQEGVATPNSTPGQ